MDFIVFSIYASSFLAAVTRTYAILTIRCGSLCFFLRNFTVNVCSDHWSEQTLTVKLRKKKHKDPHRMVNMAYVLVTAARNEEAYIENTIKSIISQTVKPEKWVIVSDGSTDRTND